MDSGAAEGLVLTWTPDSLELGLIDDSFLLTSPDLRDISVLRVHWAEVSEIMRHRSRTHGIDGLLLGSLVGAVGAGTYAGFAWQIDPQYRIRDISIAAVIGAALGGLVGGYVGEFVETEWWESVAIPARGSNDISLVIRWLTPRR